MAPPAKAPSVPGARRYAPLAGAALETYARTASRLVLAGRLNQAFCDPYGCAEMLRCLAPSVRGGVCDGIELDLASGLPSLQDMVSLRADRDVAEEFLSEADARLAAGRRPTPKVEAKTAYYRKLAAAAFPRLHGLCVRLRRVVAERGVSAFEAVFDRYDPAESVFLRYTLLLEQTDGSSGAEFLRRSGDYTLQTNGFREKMEKFTGSDSEIAFLLLGKLDGVRVEEVTRARIGPLWSPWAPAPEGWVPPGTEDRSFVLHLPFDRASVDIDKDRDDDPFSTIFRSFLSAQSRPLVEEEAYRLGYRVNKQRKFVCTAECAPLLRGRLAEAGVGAIVYTI